MDGCCVDSGLWMNVSCMDEFLVNMYVGTSWMNVLWMVSREYVFRYFIDECIVESINRGSSEEKQVTHNNTY